MTSLAGQSQTSAGNGPDDDDNADLVEGSRGFFVSSTTDSKTIQEIYLNFITGRVNTNSWHFRSKVVRAAKHNFGRFDTWLKEQADEALLYGRRDDFMRDTLNFISTGRRRISVVNWMDLLEEDPEMRRDLVNVDLMDQYKQYGLNLHSTPQIIARWCAQPKGFDDMLCTLNILFGPKKGDPS